MNKTSSQILDLSTPLGQEQCAWTKDLCERVSCSCSFLWQVAAKKDIYVLIIVFC